VEPRPRHSPMHASTHNRTITAATRLDEKTKAERGVTALKIMGSRGSLIVATHVGPIFRETQLHVCRGAEESHTECCDVGSSNCFTPQCFLFFTH
jgi:hypothetical protein